jgi:hypothetical protein
MTILIAAVLMGLWTFVLLLVTAVPIFFRDGAREWHRRARAHHERRHRRR